MTTAASSTPRIESARLARGRIRVRLVDGREISLPLSWSWRLSDATPAQRANFRLIGTGQGLHWPDLDEDLSVEGMLSGSPTPRPKSRTAASVRERAAGGRGTSARPTRPSRPDAAPGTPRPRR